MVKHRYTLTLIEQHREQLRDYCERRLWESFAVDYAWFAFKNKAEKVTVIAYQSGKVVIAGKGTEAFVLNVLETEISGEPQMGYEAVHHPEWFEEHAGLDEAGKGDLFGPLVCATVIAGEDAVRQWLEAGVGDSKKIADKRILALEKIIRQTPGVVIETASCGMARYNALMARPNANLNKLLGWLHARALDDALQKKLVPWGLLDRFSRRPIVQEYLKTPNFDLQMRTKAESDPVVAAASIVARAGFIRAMETLSRRYGEPLLKGASAQVKHQGQALVHKLGATALGDFAKMHFKTAREILAMCGRGSVQSQD